MKLKSYFISRNLKHFLIILGQGEEISEEVAEEILMEDKCKAGLNNCFLLKFRLQENGIHIENPIPKPEQEKTWMATKFVTTIEFDRWQEYESKLVKAVIIRINK